MHDFILELRENRYRLCIRHTVHILALGLETSHVSIQECLVILYHALSIVTTFLFHGDQDSKVLASYFEYVLATC